MGRSLALVITALAVTGGGCDGCSCSGDDPLAAPGPPASASAVPSARIDPAGPRSARCPSFAGGSRTGNLKNAAVLEASGLAASRTNRGVLWVHNDSGHDPELFAMSETGEHLATYSVDDSECVDWEDMAVGPGPDGRGDALYIADTGANVAVRERFYVLRAPEPVVVPSPEPRALNGVERIALTYPDGRSRDAETLLVDPKSGDLYLVTKSRLVSKRRTGAQGVYRARAPLRPGALTPMEHVATLEFPATARGTNLATSGDISFDRRWLLIKTYTHAYLWPIEPSQEIADALASAPCPVPLESEPQGEAITFGSDGLSYFTVSEGAGSPIHRFLPQP